MNKPTLHRRGFTLLEMALVLAIIVAIGAIAAPLFRGTLEIERLRKGVELVAADWIATSAMAMETGETQVWLCEVGSTSFSSSTYSNTGGLTPTEAASMVADTTGLSATSGSTSGSGSFGQTMPDGVSVSEVMVTEGDTIMTMAENSSADAASATVFFYPDGTSSSARLTVIDEKQRTMSVVMNGLAGTVRVMDTIGGGTQ